eukprot:jgi/Mesen1/7691/ME000405S06977
MKRAEEPAASSASPLLPGLPHDLALLCLARVAFADRSRVRATCKAWKAILDSDELYQVRRREGCLEEFLCVCGASSIERDAIRAVNPARDSSVFQLILHLYHEAWAGGASILRSQKMTADNVAASLLRRRGEPAHLARPQHAPFPGGGCVGGSGGRREVNFSSVIGVPIEAFFLMCPATRQVAGPSFARVLVGCASTGAGEFGTWAAAGRQFIVWCFDEMTGLMERAPRVPTAVTHATGGASSLYVVHQEGAGFNGNEPLPAPAARSLHMLPLEDWRGGARALGREANWRRLQLPSNVKVIYGCYCAEDVLHLVHSGSIDELTRVAAYDPALDTWAEQPLGLFRVSPRLLLGGSPLASSPAGVFWASRAGYVYNREGAAHVDSDSREEPDDCYWRHVAAVGLGRVHVLEDRFVVDGDVGDRTVITSTLIPPEGTALAWLPTHFVHLNVYGIKVAGVAAGMIRI